jgi:hypothetical protein
MYGDLQACLRITSGLASLKRTLSHATFAHISACLISAPHLARVFRASHEALRPPQARKTSSLTAPLIPQALCPPQPTIVVLASWHTPCFARAGLVLLSHTHRACP